MSILVIVMIANDVKDNKKRFRCSSILYDVLAKNLRDIVARMVWFKANVHQVDTMQLIVGDLVEVLADDQHQQFWYGEITQTHPELAVNYISVYKGDTWRFDAQAYVVERECINHIVRNASKERAWKELGFVYRGDHEILHEKDCNTEDDDEDWAPEESDEDEEDDDDDESEDDSEDSAVEKDDDISDVLNSDEEDESDESEDDSDDENVPTKRARRETGQQLKK